VSKVFPTECVPWTHTLEKAVKIVSRYPLGDYVREDLWDRVRRDRRSDDVPGAWPAALERMGAHLSLIPSY
jgi:hypothetical protein